MKLAILCGTISIAVLIVACTKSTSGEMTHADSVKRAKEIADSAKAIEKANELRFLASLDSLKKISAQWRVNSFVDKFGDPTNDRYLKISADGTFSNSATSGEYLFAEIIVTKKSVGIFLHEYKATRPAEKPIGSYTINMKNSAGKTVSMHSSSSWNDEGGISLHNYDWSPDVSTFRKFLLASEGSIKFVISGEYQGVYRFSIDVSDFKQKYSEL